MTARSNWYVSSNSKVLELRTGTGSDQDALKQVFETMVWSNFSQIFFPWYLAKHPDADIRWLHAVAINSNLVKDKVPFDTIFTNKVVQHLTETQFQQSLRRKAEIVKTGGVLFHTLWYGDDETFHEGLRFENYIEQPVDSLIQGTLEFLASEKYFEMSDHDSMVAVLRRVEGSTAGTSSWIHAIVHKLDDSKLLVAHCPQGKMELLLCTSACSQVRFQIRRTDKSQNQRKREVSTKNKFSHTEVSGCNKLTKLETLSTIDDSTKRNNTGALRILQPFLTKSVTQPAVPIPNPEEKMRH